MPIVNYGLEWEYDLGMWGQWDGDPTSELVNFEHQLGIYVIYKRKRIWYVGKSASGLTAGVLGRLKGHRNDGWKFSTFSWFGYHPVGEDGLLDAASPPMPVAASISNLEALLIFLLAPPKNKATGAYKHIREYRQVR